MKIAKRIIIGMLALFVVLGAVTGIYLQTTKPTYAGELTLTGLHEAVEVFYDDFGVPHIYATNQEDAYFALGYVHAQDRLFQMEMLRRAAGGRLSEILGPDLLHVDKLFRTLGLNQFAKEQAERFLRADSSDFQKAVLAYQQGVNQFIKTGSTPVEFLIIGIPKEEFTPQDIYLAVGFMSFGFAEGLRADPVLQIIKSQWGEDYLKVVAVETPRDAVRIPTFDGHVKLAQTLVASIQEALYELPVPLWRGSNGWVISGDKTASGFPILANDTHIGFSQPAAWYEAHLEYPGYSFYGHHLAGIPFGLLGNNRKTAWGLTMFENDDTDFFIETPNPENPNQVKFKDHWEDLAVRTEIIKVKGMEDVSFAVKSSRHGNLVSGIIENTPESQPVALSWILTQVTNESLKCLYLLNHATSIADAQEAASQMTAPGLNIMYGDRDGNIAWWAVAKLPIRPPHAQSKFFLEGASGNDEYLGFYEFSKNPHAVNPPAGFVYSSNNQPDSVEGVLYPGYYYPKDRAGRIVELLSADKKWTPKDIESVNLDVVSSTAPEVGREIAAVLKSLSNPEFLPLIGPLENWNGDHKVTDVAPSIYYNLLAQIMNTAMRDELGKTAFEAFMQTAIPKNSILTFIGSDTSPWWDDVHTGQQKETRSQIFERAAKTTLGLLRSTSGPAPADWTWGKIHTLTHRHPLASVKPLDKIFNVGPFPVDGGREVINNMDFGLDTTGYFAVLDGPALRKISDLGEIDHGVTVSPTGQSGNVMSRFYEDEAELFVTGKFRPMLMNRKEIETVSKYKLILKP